MSADLKLSEHCIVSHQEWIRNGGPLPKMSPQTFLRWSFLLLDRKMHFTGLRGTTWRVLGIDRSDKNPNLCNS